VAVPRPVITPSTSTSGGPGSTTRVNGNAVRPVSLTPGAAKPTLTSSQADEPVPPSHDFLKWLNDSLKGLNSSVNGLYGLLSHSLDF
jgi:PERQ amino acid-rich with GYF domain-containing protein